MGIGKGKRMFISGYETGSEKMEEGRKRFWDNLTECLKGLKE